MALVLQPFHTVWETHHSDLSSSGLAFIPYDPIVSEDDWGEKRELAEQAATTSYSMGCRSSKKLGLNELDSNSSVQATSHTV